MTRKINIVLAVILMVTIFSIGIITTATKATELGYATFVSYTQYLSGDGPLARVKAHIKSLSSAIDLNLASKTFFESLNAQFQLSIGKEMISYGSRTMVKLKGGQLYDVQADTDVTSDLDKLDALSKSLAAEGIPMMFVYMHSELYDNEMLPSGVRDYNLKVADDIVCGLRARGIDVLDTREILSQQGMAIEDAIYRTDQHCANPMNFAVYGEVVKYLNGLGWNLDASLADEANFDIQVIENAHMGGVGQRVGSGYVNPDDMTIYTPKFDTWIHRSLSSSEGFIETEGTFEDAVLNMDVLGALEDVDCANLYDVYGYHTEVVKYKNEQAPDKKLLLVKDSFGTPVASLLSLVAGEVVGVDVRKTQRAVESYVEEYKPEAVVIVHCQEMMRGKNYVFVDG